MLKYIVPICCGLISVSTAQAQDCPDAFRFVDFGLPATDGTLYRGGPTYRVELDGARIFQPGTVACRDVGPIFFDGHNHPIPVVKTFGYDPARVADHMYELVVSRTSGALARAAKKAADLHQSARFAEGAVITHGETFLCAAPADTSRATFSCEVVNPFDTTTSLIASCDQTGCRTEAMAIGDEITITASWAPPQSSSASASGRDVVQTIATIHAFFDDKTAQ